LIGTVVFAVTAREQRGGRHETSPSSLYSSASVTPWPGFGFPSDVIVVAVRWYLRFGLAYRHVELHRLLPSLLQVLR